MSMYLKRISVVAAGAFVAFLLAVALPMTAQAETVNLAPAGADDASDDTYAIQAAIDNGDKLVLQSGATYYIHSNIKVKSGTSIIATGATIISTATESCGFRNDVQLGKYNYNSCVGVKIKGGTWKHQDKDGYKHSTIQFTHASNITLDGVTAEASYEGHAAEFIACKNVKILNCKFIGIGSYPKSCREEQLQFDVAGAKTAPTVKSNFGAAATKGQTCQNITVKNSTITGCRGMTTNFEPGTSNVNKFHKNITVTGCKITGLNAEGLALFNVLGKVNVSKNTIISKCKRTGVADSVGCHLSMFGKAPKAMNKSKFTFKSNTIKGGRQAFFVCAHCKSKYPTVTFTKNKAYCKKGKANAIKAAYSDVTKAPSVKKFKSTKNKTYKW